MNELMTKRWSVAKVKLAYRDKPLYVIHASEDKNAVVANCDNQEIAVYLASMHNAVSAEQ